MKKANIAERSSYSGKLFCVKSSNDFIRDTISRIEKLRDHAKKTGMQIASTMPRSLFIQKAKSGGNDV